MFVNPFVIKTVIALKLITLAGMLVSVILLSYDQHLLQTSVFPEHRDFLMEKEGFVAAMLILLIPLALSVIVDLKEIGTKALKGKWYLLTLLLLTCYVLINQLKGHYSVYIVAIAMSIVLVVVIRHQNLFLRKSIATPSDPV